MPQCNSRSGSGSRTQVDAVSAVWYITRMNCRHFSWLSLWLAGSVLAAGPADKVHPTPAQGSISPSGKFTPAPVMTPDTATGPRAPGDAEALLKHVQKLEQTRPQHLSDRAR